MNCWALSVAYLSSMRSTNLLLNNQPYPNGANVNQWITITSEDPYSFNNLQVPGGFASRHPLRANFAFGDGHVQYIQFDRAVYLPGLVDNHPDGLGHCRQCQYVAAIAGRWQRAAGN